MTAPQAAGEVAAQGEGGATTPAPRVIGLDLSLTGTGVAASLLGWVATIRSKGTTSATLSERDARIRAIASEVIAYAATGELVVIEAPAFSRTTGHMHDRSGLWWRVVGGLLAREIAVVEVTATCRARYATGKGNAGKDEVLAAVVRRYPDVPVSNNNEADALVLAAMGARALGHPIDDLPKTHLAAMSAVVWPEPVTA